MTQLKPSGLERAFGFENEAFREYVTGRSPLPQRSLELGQCLTTCEHPLGLYAAGWVAAELALYRYSGRKPKNSISLDRRLESLETARERWEVASERFVTLRERSSGEHLQGNIRSMELRLREALAYIPALQLGAAVLTGAAMAEEDIQATRINTSRNASQVAQYALGLDTNTAHMRAVQRGSISELTFGAVGQIALPVRYVVFPASIRQDNNARTNLRADYVALSLERPHYKTLVQVTSSTEHDASRPQYCEIVGRRDLVLAPSRAVSETLSAFTDWVDGSISPNTETQLQATAYQALSVVDKFSSMHYGW